MHRSLFLSSIRLLHCKSNITVEASLTNNADSIQSLEAGQGLSWGPFTVCSPRYPSAQPCHTRYCQCLHAWAHPAISGHPQAVSGDFKRWACPRIWFILEERREKGQNQSVKNWVQNSQSNVCATCLVISLRQTNQLSSSAITSRLINMRSRNHARRAHAKRMSLRNTSSFSDKSLVCFEWAQRSALMAAKTANIYPKRVSWTWNQHSWEISCGKFWRGSLASALERTSRQYSTLWHGSFSCFF